MAKNVERYIATAIQVLLKEEDVQWELIVIDDHSTDNTLSVAKKFADNDGRVKVFKNKYTGKVLGTNYGYALSVGQIIKCIDSDDILSGCFFKFIPQMLDYDAHCHAALIVDEALSPLATYSPNKKIINSSFQYSAVNLLSLPKWSWSFSREIGDKIFPLPNNLPFEDVWISLLIKKHAFKILVIKEPLYFYRQHDNQTFGGIINFNKDVVVYRAKRILKLIKVIENEPRILCNELMIDFSAIKFFNELLSKEFLSWKMALFSKLNYSLKMKLIFYRFYPTLCSSLIKLKWFFDAKS